MDLIRTGQDTPLDRSTGAGKRRSADVRFIVQAANGVGLVTQADNLGRYYRRNDRRGAAAR
ncbi:MAG: hypothetical protein R2851_01995 [Caldilineaceae bacterium]